MKQVTFREAAAEDGAGMLAVHLAAIHAVDDRFYDRAARESWAFGLTAEWYWRKMAEGERIEAAVAADGRILAFCSISNGEVMGLYVHPDAQGRGIGATLLKRGEARLMSQARERLPLTASLNAQAFYETHGYRLVEHVEMRSRGGLMQKAARMEKRLLPGPGDHRPAR